MNMHAMLVDENQTLRWSEVPAPAPKENEALIEVHAAALNRADLLQRAGKYCAFLFRTRHDAGRNAVDVDIVRSKLHRKRAGEGEDRAFGCRVFCAVRQSADSDRRADEDDLAPFRLHHAVDDGAGAAERAEHIHFQHILHDFHFLVFEFSAFRAGGTTGDVDENVDGAEALRNGIHELDNGCVVCDVRHETLRGSSGGADGIRSCVRGFPADVDDGDICALFREFPADFGADASAAARNGGRSVFQFPHDDFPLFCISARIEQEFWAQTSTTPSLSPAAIPS